MVVDIDTYHAESIDNLFPQVKIIIVLFKNTTVRLPPLDPEINQNFKFKHRKKLVKYVFPTINKNSSAT